MKVKCWDIFTCNDEGCPVYKLKELRCWLVSGTHCRQEIQGKFLEKMEMCLSCEIFEANMDVDAMKDTLDIVDKQFKEFRAELTARDKELEDTSMELALGLSEAFEALNKVATGDPRARISGASANELIAKLKQTVNKTAEGIEAVVNQSHEFAIGIAEHFDVLNRVSKGELSARISESSEEELLKALGRVTNHMIESVSREITERKKAEEVLREKEEREALILSSLPMVFYTALPSGGFDWIWVSEQIEQITGFTADDYINEKHFWASRIHPEDRDNVLKQRKTIYDKGTIAIEYRWQCSDDLYRWFKDQSVLIKDEQGNPKEVIGTWRDITERKRAEEEIRKLNEELEQRVLQRTAQLEAANKELEAFSYSVSHDLRAPVRAIDGFSRILLEDYGDKYDAEGKRLVNIIRSNTKKMGDLIDDLLALSRLGRRDIEISDIDMDKLVKGLFDELGLDTNNGKVQFNIKPLPHAQGDQGMIHQVFANLLLNAIKFTKPKDKAVVEIGGYAENSKNVYYVKDNGVGFDMQYADKLFGVFQRLHSEEEFEGTGIGLAIVQRIIKRHGGMIWAEGKVNEGATFYFALPLKEGR